MRGRSPNEVRQSERTAERKIAERQFETKHKESEPLRNSQKLKNQIIKREKVEG